MPDAEARACPAADETASLLRASPIFAGLPAGELARLAARARDASVRARQYVFTEGDPAAWFCLVRRGRVKIFRHARSGRHVVLELLGPGEAFGGVAVIEERPYPASAQATEPSVVTKLPADAIRPLAERYPAIVRELALLIGQRLRAAHDSVAALTVDPVEVRLAAQLARLADREGVASRGGVALPFHLTRQGLADMSGTTVETAIRVLGRWQRAGLLANARGRLVVADLGRLRQLGEGA